MFKLAHEFQTPFVATPFVPSQGLAGNQWRMQSELARTTAVVPRPMVPNPSDLLHVTDANTFDGDSKINKEDKAAQRGPHVAQAYLEALFTKASVPSSDRVPGLWIQPGEETWLLDLTAWAGDRGMASLNMMEDSKFGVLRHVFVDPGYKRLGQGATFSHLRASNEVAKQWMARTRVLYDHHVDVRGQVTKVPKQPLDSVPQPAEDILKQTPGAWEAWKGLSALELKVCVVRGPKIVIAPEKLAEFQHAPLSISEEVRCLEAKHKDFENVLEFMATQASPNPASSDQDPREDSGASPPNQESVDFITMESLAALEAFAPGLIEHQCGGDKHVTMYKDEKRKEVWLLSKTDDHIVPRGTMFGGFGSGHLNARKAERTDCVPWSLPDGDKSYVQLTTSEESDSKSKSKVGTLYTMIKPLEKLASQKGTQLTLTSYGKLEPKGAAGKHGFGFEFPDAHPKHSAQDYLLAASKAGPKTTNSGNIFASLASRDGWAGVCISMWRLAHDPVRHALHARKPVVIAKENINLKKGVPMKVLWLKRGDPNSPNPAVAPPAAEGEK